MSDEAATIERQSAYLDRVRSLGRPQRLAGFVACALGVALLVFARFKLNGTPWVLWPAIGVIALGWALFIYALARRLIWVRAHPFDPNTPLGNNG